MLRASNARPYILDFRERIAIPQNLLPSMRADCDEIRAALGVIILRQAVDFSLRFPSLQPEILKQIVEMGVVIGVVIVDILLIFRVEIRLFALIPLGVLA